MSVLGGQHVITSTDTHSLIPNPPSGKVTMYHYSGDGLFYVRDSAGTYTAVGSAPGAGALLQDGTIAMAADFQLLNNAFIIDDITTPSNPSSGLFKLYLKSDGNLYTKNSSGTETQLTRIPLSGVILADGSVPFSGELQLANNDILAQGISTPSTPASSNFKLYFKSNGHLYSLNDVGSETQVDGGGGGGSGSDVIYRELTGQAISNTGAQSSLLNSGVGTLTIAANDLAAGDILRFHLSAFGGSKASSSGDFRIDFLMNANSVSLLGPLTMVDGESGAFVTMDAEILFQTIGASATVRGKVTVYCELFSVPFSVFYWGSTVDTTIDNDLDIAVTFGTSDVANTLDSTSGLTYIERL